METGFCFGTSIDVTWKRYMNEHIKRKLDVVHSSCHLQPICLPWNKYICH